MARNDGDATPFLPPGRLSLPKLRDAASECEGCELFRIGTQTVFGAGPASSRILLVGEQPGDSEDRSGVPFVGPAGKILERALAEAGISRTSVYVTNAVKHFNHELRGKKRLHAKPKMRHIRACRPWLEAEVKVVRPRVIVCMGAVATMAVLGPDAMVTRDRGRDIQHSPMAAHVVVTEHPSALLRGYPEEREERFAGLVSDLKFAASLIG